MANLGETRCHIGLHLDVSCNTVQSVEFNSLSDEDKKLLKWRTGLKNFSPDSKLCRGHTDSFLRYYAGNQRSCFDPYGKHKTRITKGLREVTIDVAEDLKDRLHINVIPGMKYCDTCRKSVSCEIKKIEPASKDDEKLPDPDLPESDEHSLPTSSESGSQDPSSQAVSNYSNTDSQICKEKLSDIFDQLNLEQINLNMIHEKSKAALVKRKIEEATHVMCKRAKFAYHLSEDIECFSSEGVEEKAKQYEEIMDRIKIVISSCNYATKLRLLTLVPNLQQKKIQSYLGITRSTATAALQLKEEKGVFSVPDKKRGSSALSEEDKQKVIDFYCDETSGNSKMLPGKKDCVSIGKKSYKQKQLLLLNLRELYAAYKCVNPDSKIGLSRFCLLRPKWCVLAGSPGTHAICVCTIHQNVELQLHAVGSKFSLDEVISKVVCDPTKKVCMLRECKECPSEEEVNKILRDLLDQNTGNNRTIREEEREEEDEESDDEESEEDVIEFKQWVSTDRTELISRNLSKTEFNSFLSSAIQKLLPHAYTTTEQFKHIKKLKESLENDACIVLMDFSENYNFITQDQAQGYYWTKNSCTVHPVVIYFKHEDTLKHQSLCFLSDDLKHDTSIVHVFQDRIINYVKQKLPHIQRVHYFSDGCPGQYKNCNNILRLCEHQTKYQLSATWSFFATSHGKSPCDGIGGTIKREAANESLRRPFRNQIIDVDALLQFCNERITSVHCEIVSKEDAEENRKVESTKAWTIPGTRSYHEFVPLNDHVIQCKKTSTDPEYCLKFDIVNNKKVRT